MKLQDMIISAFAFVAALLLIPYVITWGMNGVGSMKQQTKQLNYNISLEVALQDGKETMNLETYLYSVVPSEMPANYELEALKAQALCARSYAYNAVLHGSYSAYGAHMDDSTSFQVYGNHAENERTIQAVKETCGEVAKYEDNVIEAYYYSTSCGITSNASIWGQSVPYLKSKITP